MTKHAEKIEFMSSRRRPLGFKCSFKVQPTESSRGLKGTQRESTAATIVIL